MTDKKWNKEEYDEVKKIQKSHEQIQREFAIEGQKKLVDSSTDPIQKAKYLRGLRILERGGWTNKDG